MCELLLREGAEVNHRNGEGDLFDYCRISFGASLALLLFAGTVSSFGGNSPAWQAKRVGFITSQGQPSNGHLKNGVQLQIEVLPPLCLTPVPIALRVLGKERPLYTKPAKEAMQK